MKTFFFIAVYVLLGTLGVTIPMVIHWDIIPSEIAIGLVTVAMSSVGYNASEKILESYDEKPSNKRILGFYLFALIAITIITIVVCIRAPQEQEKDGNNLAFILSIIAYIISCIFWWVQNWNNRNLENTSASTLGGDSNQFNK